MSEAMQPPTDDSTTRSTSQEGTNARRQKVIGGDLTGVSDQYKQRNSWFRRRSNMTFVNWIAAIIVVLIIAAFFWPHPKNDITQEVSAPIANNTITETPPPFYSESRVDETPPATDKKPFVREDDIQRVAEFRAQERDEKKIKNLLARADERIAKNHLTLPTNANAITPLKNILKLDANNVEARQRLDTISDRILGDGYTALENNDQAAATAVLGKLQTIDENSEQSSEFSNRLAQWQKTNEINGLLSKANTAVSKGSLIIPADGSALHYFRQVLTLDADNTDAKKGIGNIVDGYINKTNAAIKAGEYEAATGYLATVSVIDPSNNSIELLQNIIEKAKPIARNTQENQQVAANAPPVRAQPVRETPPAEPTSTPGASARTNNTTPSTQADEQELIDRQYLQLGLDAYYKGEYDTAAALLQPLADKGVTRAQFRIAYMHYQGRGFRQSKSEADRMIRAALPSIRKFAEQGRSWAQSDLASLYEDGLVLTRDYAEAIYWYRSAAEQGYPGAQTNLGIMYADGRGVDASRQTAIEWFRKAAQQGDALAKRNLATLLSSQ